MKDRHVVPVCYSQRAATSPWLACAILAWIALSVLACARPAIARTYDESSTSCAVSYDGDVWYRVPAGTFSPIDVRFTQCGSFALSRYPNQTPPAWAVPDGPTQALFVATSLQQRYSISGMLTLAGLAKRYSIPMTWMIGDLWWLGLDAYYDRFHEARGDDVEAEAFASLHDALRESMPWYVPAVSVAGAGEERDLQRAAAFGERAFWGIAWNSDGTDATFDRGSPWGAYCADPRSYKRPDPSPSCREVAFEWTARDLTRAYLSGREDWFSTDPDDLQRAGLRVDDARRYVGRVIDAYAAAGEGQPIVVVSQQESGEGDDPGDAAIMDALYERVARDRIRAVTLRTAANLARRFAARPRAIAFPSLAFGPNVPSLELDGDSLYPATIDYHDRAIGATFLAGHTMPTRVFEYSDDGRSSFRRPLHRLPPGRMPRLLSATAKNGSLRFTLDAPASLPYAIAVWSAPGSLRVSGRPVVDAGRAGLVVPLLLRRGVQTITVRCAGCTNGVLPYAT